MTAASLDKIVKIATFPQAGCPANAVSTEVLSEPEA
jgi:hypothetical protein